MKKVLLLIVIMVLLAVILVPVVALAADGAEQAQPAVDWTQLVIASVGLVFSGILIPLVKAGFSWLKSKTENEAIKAALSEAQAIADNIVASLQQTVVDELKSRSADRKLSAEDAREVADLAVERFLSDLSLKSTEVLERNTKDIVQFASNLIEARLLNLRLKERV